MAPRNPKSHPEQLYQYKIRAIAASPCSSWNQETVLSRKQQEGLPAVQCCRMPDHESFINNQAEVPLARSNRRGTSAWANQWRVRIVIVQKCYVVSLCPWHG